MVEEFIQDPTLQSELSKFMNKYDLDRNGHLDLDEFTKFMEDMAADAGGFDASLSQ